MRNFGNLSLESHSLLIRHSQWQARKLTHSHRLPLLHFRLKITNQPGKNQENP
jgi:hypothetical protein